MKGADLRVRQRSPDTEVRQAFLAFFVFGGNAEYDALDTVLCVFEPSHVACNVWEHAGIGSINNRLFAAPG